MAAEAEQRLMGSMLFQNPGCRARSFFLATLLALLISLGFFLGYCQRYVEFNVSFPGTSWVHLYPSQGGAAGLLKYKGVRVESSGRPTAVRIPLVPAPMDALLIRIEQPGGVVSVRDVRIVNALGNLIVKIDRSQVENSASSMIEEAEGGVDLSPTGLSRIIDMRLNFTTPLEVVPDGAGFFFVKLFFPCLLIAFALLEAGRFLARGISCRSVLPGIQPQPLGTPCNLSAAAAGVFLIILGTRLWLINSFGSDLPFWDQWDAEAKNLYIPYFNGTLSLSDLFSPHNEHRIFLARLVALVLLMLNKTWDPLLQMSLNAAFYAGVGAFLFRVMARPSPLLWGASVALLFSLPFGWQNTLGGFQLPVYLLVGLSLLFLWFMTCCESRWMRWLGGGGTALFLLFTMASGFLVCAALLLTSILDAGKRGGPRRFRNIVPVALLSLPAIAAGLLLKVDVPDHLKLQAGSLSEFTTVLAANLGWPLSMFPMFGAEYPLSVAGFVFSAVLLWSPFAILFRNFMKERESSGKMMLLVAVGIWIVLQAAAAAYARGSSIFPSSRYQDLFAIGLLVNVSSLLMLRCSRQDGGEAGRFSFIALPWLMGVVSGLLFLTAMNFVHDLPEKHSQQQASLEHVRRFIATGDLGALTGKPQFDIPHPEREELAALLNNAEIRRILPPAVTGSGDPGRLKPMLDPVLHSGIFIAAAGVICFCFTLIRRGARATDKTGK